MRVSIYSRVSKDRFGDERSPERQEAACRALVASREWLVVDAHRDVDLSAYKDVRRPGYDALLADVDDGRCDAVCVWKLDRLVRRPREFERFWEHCERAGVALVSVTEPIDSSTELGLAIVRVLVTFASLESATRSVRLRSAYRDKALRGKPHAVAGRPFGYTAGWRAIVPEEASLVREAAQRVLAGETMAEVARDWTLRGLRTPRGALWTVHRIRDLLISPRFWGMRTYHGDIVAKGDWPAILDEETGARLLYLLADTSRRREPRTGRPSLLTGALRCGNCGSRMITRRSGRGDMTYCCPSPPRGCNGVSARARYVDAVVVDALLAELRAQRDRVPAAVVAIPANDRAAVVTSHASALKAAADDYYVRKIIDRPTFLAVRDALDRDLHERIGAPPTPPRLRALYADPDAAWPALDHAQKRAAVSAVIDHVIIHPAPRSSGRFRPNRVEVVFPGQTAAARPAPPAPDIDPVRDYTPREAAGFLDLCQVTVQRMLRNGDLRGRRTDGHWLVTGQEVVRCRDLRNIAGVKRVRRSSAKFAEILRDYNAARAAVGAGSAKRSTGVRPR